MWWLHSYCMFLSLLLLLTFSALICKMFIMALCSRPATSRCLIHWRGLPKSNIFDQHDLVRVVLLMLAVPVQHGELAIEEIYHDVRHRVSLVVGISCWWLCRGRHQHPPLARGTKRDVESVLRVHLIL